jgi:hypothetical protein
VSTAAAGLEFGERFTQTLVLNFPRLPLRNLLGTVLLLMRHGRVCPWPHKLQSTASLLDRRNTGCTWRHEALLRP